MKNKFFFRAQFGFVSAFCALCFSALCFNACKDTPPSWYFSAQSDKENLYGVGSGANLQSAKDNALNDMLSALQVELDSQTSLNQSFSNGIESSSMSLQIEKHISKTTLSNVTYKTELTGNTYYARAQVSKAVFLKQLKEEQKTLAKELSALNLSCKDLNLSEFNMLNAKLEEAQQTQNYLYALGSEGNLSLAHYVSLWEANAPKPKLALVLENPNAYGAKVMQNALQKELVKFYRLDSSSSQKALFSFELLGPTALEATLKIINCKGDTTLVLQISADIPSPNIDKLAQRAGVIFFKKLESLQEQ